ncbi:MAG: phosphoadenylyl-sulfate reductase [Bacteroidia bacterium]|nr:phosphoadenylyl-sulfate reductase [Bacteroidia bacterium]
MDSAELNEKYQLLSPEERFRAITQDFQKVLLTSSFGTTAGVSLHLWSKTNQNKPVYFLDTTYHFPETLQYKDTLTRQLQLNVVTLKGDEWRNKFTREDKTWEKDPDLCCSINKVEPLNAIKPQFDIWISGLMKSQNEHRSSLNFFEKKNGIIKFYPLIDITEKQAFQYLTVNGIPEHPLKIKGYNSVGCLHCTSPGKSREGRWIDKSKTECGLHE